MTPLLTDLYQLTMAYGYWKSGRHEEAAVFDLFFRKNPFRGEFTIFAGLDEVLRFLGSFSFSESDLEYVAKTLNNAEQGFMDWLADINCRRIRVRRGRGSRLPARAAAARLRAARHRAAARDDAAQPRELPLLWPRTRRACASRRVRARCLWSSVCAPRAWTARSARPSTATWAASTRRPTCSQESSRTSPSRNARARLRAELHVPGRPPSTALLSNENFLQSVLDTRTAFGFPDANDGELAAFVSYAQAFPDGFLALVDTYDTLSSGVPNFISVAVQIFKLGRKLLGLRLDSGDLSYYSIKSRELLRAAAKQFNIPSSRR